LSPETQRKLEQPKGWGFDVVTEKTRYVDLTKDREEFTGYQGQKIWKYLYNNHCQQSFDVCQDNKFLYKMISGMHASVSSHLSNFFIDFETNKVFQNIEIYQDKVGLH
jgi:ERO1-like protein alpha